MKNVSLYMPLIKESVSLIRVRFLTNSTSNTYVYKCDIDGVEAGDTVVVEANSTMSVARVVQVGLPLPMDDERTTYKWVVGKIDMDAHRLRRKEEQAVIEQVNVRRAAHSRDSLLMALGLTSDEAQKMLGSVVIEQPPATDAGIVVTADDEDIVRYNDDDDLL